ncbi:MAG: helix-turn-helix domain-containing protein [Candidatus Eremiobacteraeota bacterium]|nr:helix-turn-helix domain-containing protein [Candidatus Eremiobacteraeota bacterium]
MTITDYRCRFGVSLRSFRRDIALLREAGLYIDTATPGTYRMVCFVFDTDHA